MIAGILLETFLVGLVLVIIVSLICETIKEVAKQKYRR